MHDVTFTKNQQKQEREGKEEVEGQGEGGHMTHQKQHPRWISGLHISGNFLSWSPPIIITHVKFRWVKFCKEAPNTNVNSVVTKQPKLPTVISKPEA